MLHDVRICNYQSNQSMLKERRKTTENKQENKNATMFFISSHVGITTIKYQGLHPLKWRYKHSFSIIIFNID